MQLWILNFIRCCLLNWYHEILLKLSPSDSLINCSEDFCAITEIYQFSTFYAPGHLELSSSGPSTIYGFHLEFSCLLLLKQLIPSSWVSLKLLSKTPCSRDLYCKLFMVYSLRKKQKSNRPLRGLESCLDCQLFNIYQACIWGEMCSSPGKSDSPRCGKHFFYKSRFAAKIDYKLLQSGLGFLRWVSFPPHLFSEVLSGSWLPPFPHQHRSHSSVTHVQPRPACHS